MSRYTLDLGADGSPLGVESISYTETNAIVPLTGRFTYITSSTSPFDAGDDFVLGVYTDGLLSSSIGQVFIRRFTRTETDAKFSAGVKAYKYEGEFECDVGFTMEQVVSFGGTYFDPDDGLNPQTVADVVCQTYMADIDLILALEPDMRIRDFQFMGKRYEALAKLERTLGGKAYIDRDDLYIRFVPTYYNSALEPIGVSQSSVLSPFSQQKTIEMNTGVAIRGEINTVSQVATVSKTYRLGPDSWGVFVDRADLEGDPENNAALTGLMRATISHPDVYNVCDPYSDCISNIKINDVAVSPAMTVYDETTAASLSEEPTEDFMIVIDPTTVDLYRVVSCAANLPAGMWAEPIISRKAKEEVMCTFSFDVYGTNFRKYFYVVSGSTPYEEMETNDPASADAAQRCANIIAEGREFQYEAKMYLTDTADVIRPGQLVSYEGDTYLVDEVTCQSHPYSIVLKLLKKI